MARPRFPTYQSALSRLLDGFSRQGRELFEKYAPAVVTGRGAPAPDRADRMAALARVLLSIRGEASGVAIASDLLGTYEASTAEERAAFFRLLATAFETDGAKLAAAWQRYLAEGAAALPDLSRAAEAPRLELFRRLNLAPGGTAALVRLRADLIAAAKGARDAFAAVDADLSHLLQSWFNRGFLEMRPINWGSPARLLERIIRYEAVHQIRDWDDLRRRLDPADRRCFAFFHPAMEDEPLIFVEVALTEGIATSIQEVLATDRTIIAPEEATTAVFYSISNCQPGLRGISFGHFLIKQVANDLKRALPNLATFVTLSPIPGFGGWLRKAPAETAPPVDLARLDQPAWWDAPDAADLRDWLVDRAAEYLTEAKTADGKPLDPVARFHLGNGARLQQLDWLADISANGLRQSCGLMVNYQYDLPRIEEYHEAHAERGDIAVHPGFDRPARSPRPSRGRRAAAPARETANRAPTGAT